MLLVAMHVVTAAEAFKHVVVIDCDFYFVLTCQVFNTCVTSALHTVVYPGFDVEPPCVRKKSCPHPL